MYLFVEPWDEWMVHNQAGVIHVFTYILPSDLKEVLSTL